VDLKKYITISALLKVCKTNSEVEIHNTLVNIAREEKEKISACQVSECDVVKLPS
jgi:hypothetical protein